MSRLKPTEKAFYAQFKAAAENLDAGAKVLAGLGTPEADREKIAEQMRDLAAHGDEITNGLLVTLHASFVTPFDRSEIQTLSWSLDETIDHMEAAAGLAHLLDPPPLPADLGTMIDLLGVCAVATVDAVNKLRKLKGLDGFRAEINRLEKAADSARRALLGQLTGGEFSPLDAMKIKAMSDELMAAVAAFEAVAEIVEAVIVKES